MGPKQLLRPVCIVHGLVSNHGSPTPLEELLKRFQDRMESTMKREKKHVYYPVII